MRIRFLLIAIVFFQICTAQEAITEEVFQVVEEMPRFPGCEGSEIVEEERRNCADKRMLEFIYQNVRYPEEAINNNLEGTVVIRFVVEKDGTVSNISTLRDIGGGCAEEAIRVVEAMNTMEEKWSPGKKNGGNVRTYFNLPVKFKIEKAPEYYVDGRDTTWIKYDTAPVFEGGLESLQQFLEENLVYPTEGNDSCAIGVMNCTTLIRDNGQVVVKDITDYSDLGIDYQFAATRAITASMSKWEPAIYNGKKVSTAYDIRLTLKPTSEACATRISAFNSSYETIQKGMTLFEEQKLEEAVIEYSKALEAFPENAEFLILRGQTLFELQRMEEACKDLLEVKRRLITNAYSKLLPYLCTEKEQVELEKESGQ